MKVGNLSILQELLQVRQKLLIKCETYNIPQGGWKKESVLEGKIKCCSSDRWCSTKGQPLAHSAAHYLLTIFLTLALLQESSVMQIIKCYFIVQGLLQVQQKVCKVISVLQGTFEDACARRAQPACEVKMKWKSFMAHVPGLSLTQSFQHHFPHLTPSTAALRGNQHNHSHAAGWENLLPHQESSVLPSKSPLFTAAKYMQLVFSSFRCEHSGKLAQTTATTLPQTAQLK